MRVTTTIERGPVATMPSDQVNVEFSHLIWTNFSRPDTTYGRSDFRQHIFDILGDVG